MFSFYDCDWNGFAKWIEFHKRTHETNDPKPLPKLLWLWYCGLWFVRSVYVLSCVCTCVYCILNTQLYTHIHTHTNDACENRTATSKGGGHCFECHMDFFMRRNDSYRKLCKQYFTAFKNVKESNIPLW